MRDGNWAHQAGGRASAVSAEREKEVLANAAGYNRGPLPDTAIMRLFERILDEARSVERHAMKPDEGRGEAPKKFSE